MPWPGAAWAGCLVVPGLHPMMAEGELGFEGFEGAGCQRLGIAAACKSRLFC